MPKRSLVLTDGSSSKFWNIDLKGSEHTVTFGRIGTQGQSRTKEFSSTSEAKKSYETLIEQKLKKGYEDSGSSSTGSASKPKATPKKTIKKKTATTATKTAKKSAKKTPRKKAAAATAKESAQPTHVYLTLDDGRSSKFWQINIEGGSHTVNYGRIGTDGQSKTKEFDSADQARTSFDKLVAEKKKKGYQEADSPTTDNGKQSGKPSKQAASSAPAEPEVEVDLSTSRKLNLSPSDWAIPKYRDSKMPEQAMADDVDAAWELLVKTKPTNYGWDYPFSDIPLSTSMSEDVAKFWFAAMTENNKRIATKKEKEAFANQAKAKANRFGKMSVLKAFKLIGDFGRDHTDAIMLPLVNLLSPKDCYEVVLKLKKSNARKKHDDIDMIIKSFGTHVVPRLNKKETSEIQKSVRPDIDYDAIPDDYSNFPIEHYLAASLGMHTEIKTIVSSWDDDLYSKSESWKQYYHNPQTLVFALGSADLIESEWRRLDLEFLKPEHVRGFLAATEYSALDLPADYICKTTNKEEAKALLEALGLALAPENAEPMLKCRLESKVPSVARDWMEKNVGRCVAGLIETAGSRGKLGDAAIDYLRDVKKKGHADLIEKQVKKAGKKSAGAPRVQAEVVDYVEKVYKPFDAKSSPKWLKTALAEVDIAKKPKLPAWATSHLPNLTVGDNRLNEEQMAAVLDVLAATPIEQTHPLLTALRENVGKDCRDKFAWQLYELWIEDGANSKQKWAMGVVGHLGDDDCILKMTPLIRNWPGESQHARAVFGLQCLRRIGSNLALMQLSGIAQKLKFKGLKSKAAQFVTEIAEEKGMSRAELEDRVIPDCGLNEQGQREFSFGPRSFSFVLGGDLKPMLRDEQGKLRPNPPKPNSKDDEKVANESIAEWKLIKKQIKDTATLQASRMEQAMVTGRRWAVDDFVAFMAKHPLMTHLTQKLIWGGYDAKGKRKMLFRVTEEKDFADVDENSVTLEKVQQIGLVYPLDMKPEERNAWGEIQSDYEIISPFPQIGREIYTLEKGESTKKELARFHKLKLAAPTMVFTLEKLGWVRGVPMDGGCFDEHSKQFPSGNVTAVIGYDADGAVGMGYIDPDETIGIETVHFCQGMREPSGYGWSKAKKLKLGDVSPNVLSEVISDLNVLKSKAK